MMVLTPFVYCAYRDESECPRFASGRVEGLPLCSGHVELLERMLTDSGVELVADVDPVIKKGRAV